MNDTITISTETIKEICDMAMPEFITAMYRTVLQRAPEEAAIRNIISAYMHGYSKEEIIFNTFRSDEAKLKGILADEEWLIGIEKKRKAARRGLFNRIRKEEQRLRNIQNLIAETIGEYCVEHAEKFNRDTYHQIDYFDFENHFRGPRELIIERQKIYLDYFSGCKHVMDFGCGRGEFTELMQNSNIGVIGVDQYQPYVDYMKELGLPAVCDDGIHYLNEQESIDGLFLGQVVEHMGISAIIETCQLAYEKLEEGRYLIMETPNPMSLYIFTHSFYIDPSHEKPVHPLTLQYICQKAGFQDVQIMFTEGSKPPVEVPQLLDEREDVLKLNEYLSSMARDLYGSQDYAIIAKR